jgi:FAD/FMN-containing dehydrogenase
MDGRVVVAPDSADAIAAVLAFCSDEGVPARIAGACTWLQAGRRGGESPRLLVSTARVAGITEYNPGDLVVGVRAGTRVDDLQSALHGHGQAVPLDPPAVPGSTIGATVALNASGPLRAAHGTPRDMALGLEVVTGDGRLLRFGGRVVKNVAGYDVVRLFTGSRGVLGAVTAVYLRVRGTPEVDTSLVAEAAGCQHAAGIALSVRDALSPDALEVESGPPWRVRIRLRGGPAAVADAVSRLSSVASRTQFREVDAGQWTAAGMGEASASLHMELRGPPADLPALLAAAERYVSDMCQSDSGLRPLVSAHATAGVARCWLSGAAPVPDGEAFRSASAECVELAVTHGWTWRYNVTPEALLPVTPADSIPADRASVIMEQIRRSFDPAGILDPAVTVRA